MTWYNIIKEKENNPKGYKIKKEVITMTNTIIYNGRQYNAEAVKEYYDMELTNYSDLGAETEQEFFDEYIKLDPTFVELFDYDINPID